MKSIYLHPESETIIHALYDKHLARTGVATESRMIPTRFGETHVLLAGPVSGPPLVLLHGGNTINPTTLWWIKPLMAKYRVYAPDTLGHPGKSAPVRLSPRDNSYGQWLVDVLDALQLSQPVVMAASYGAGILLRTAAFAPQRISKAVIMIPSGLVSISWQTMFFDLLFPLITYQLAPSHTGLRRVLRPMFLENPIPEDMIEITEAVFRHVRVEPEMPRNVTKTELQNFTAPTLVLAAEYDRLFLAKRVVERARQVFRNLAAAEIIPGSTHFIPERVLPFVNARIDEFLTEAK
ncbi:MAG: alpha/beta fold hydrolase [Chloroflexota bacterium]|nr:alpha/beta hydrolase [Anaerolineales bacterium]